MEDVSNVACVDALGSGCLVYEANHGFDMEVCKVRFLPEECLIHDTPGLQTTKKAQHSWRYCRTSDVIPITLDHEPRSSTHAPHWDVQDETAEPADDEQIGISTDADCTEERILSMQREQGLLHHRLLVVEHTLQAERNKGVCERSTERLKAFKAQLRHDMFISLQQRMRRRRDRGETDFSNSLYRETIHQEYSCDLHFFSLLVSDVASSLCNVSKLAFCPSYEEIIHPSRAAKKLGVIFKNMSGLCDWLQIRNKVDRRRLFSRTIDSPGFNAIQILGGLQFGPDCDHKPLSYFFGQSCMKACAAVQEDNEEGGTATLALQRSTTNWDCTNRSFVQPLQLRSQRALRLNSNDNVVCTDAIDGFILRWCPSPRLSARMWSSDATNPDGMVLGRLALLIPSFVVAGSGFVSELQSLLQDCHVDTVM